ncbi:spondin domain-containing protein [Bythopirellula goksoeyrii]|nr:spondin domain-containing protein [Bythopirellula goksoeyrii]
MRIVSPAVAEIVQLRVTAENLAPTNSVSFAPLRIGFHNGTFDSFDSGSPAFLLGFPSIADAPIVTVAEGGSGSNWFPAFAAADPNATLGSIAPGGPFLPGASSSETFTIDTDVNPYFTFASMVVPSNDFFIGNDSPTAYQLFDGNGNLQINTINQAARQIWDAGSELDIAENAAFLQIGNNDQRVDQNGTVDFSFETLGTVFNGLTTAPGYVFDSQLSADTPVFRISFEVVPEPASLLLLGGVGLLGMIATGRCR